MFYKKRGKISERVAFTIFGTVFVGRDQDEAKLDRIQSLRILQDREQGSCEGRNLHSRKPTHDTQLTEFGMLCTTICINIIKIPEFLCRSQNSGTCTVCCACKFSMIKMDNSYFILFKNRFWI